jgi:hypothetical protein
VNAPIYFESGFLLFPRLLYDILMFAWVKPDKHRPGPADRAEHKQVDSNVLGGYANGFLCVL